MTFNIALNFEDGVTRFIQCNAGEKVLDAAYRQKVNLPMDCSDGVCGTCKCHCASGEYDLGEDYLDEALSDDEAQARQVLMVMQVCYVAEAIFPGTGIAAGLQRETVDANGVGSGGYRVMAATAFLNEP